MDTTTIIGGRFLRSAGIRPLAGAVGFSAFAGRALAVVIGFQIYKMTHSAFALGMLGLIEAIPAIGIAPFGGYVADHFDRKKILVLTRAASCVSAAVLAYISFSSTAIVGLYAMVFLAGVARGFADPAATAFEAQVVPKELTVKASSLLASIWIIASVAGPASIGFVFDAWGAGVSYLIILVSFVISWVCLAAIHPQPQEMPAEREPVFASIMTGWKYLFSRQPLWASMMLDLFAVFFGGAVALLPIYASDILKVGAKGLGILNAVPALGAFATMFAASKKPPIGHAGRNLLISVAGFGVSIIVFAFSRNFWLSCAALFMSGAFDGISVVIRRSVIRLLSPGNLRGRIASSSMIFICASNELGAFESGMVAALIGTVPCVAMGGAMTLIIAAGTSFAAKELVRLRFNTHTMERI